MSSVTAKNTFLLIERTELNLNIDSSITFNISLSEFDFKLIYFMKLYESVEHNIL